MIDFSVIILAAGSGTRMNSDIPKQYLLLGHKPVINYSLDTLSKYSSDIIVTLPDLEQTVSLPQKPQIRYVKGGISREDSIQNAISAGIKHKYVLVHDSARPFVTKDILQKICDSLETVESAYPVMPVVNSIVIDASNSLHSTPQRSQFREIQTPQGFHTEWLQRAMLAPEQTHAHIPERIRLLGGRVAHVEGSPWLFKITYKPSIYAAHAHIDEYLRAEPEPSSTCNCEV